MHIKKYWQSGTVTNMIIDNFDRIGIILSAAQGKKPNTFTNCHIQGRTVPSLARNFEE